MTTPSNPFERKDIPSAKKQQIKELHARSDRKGIINSLYVVAMYAASIVLLLVGRVTYVTIPATIFMAAAMMRGAFLMHDASHYALFKTRRWNRIVGLIFGVRSDSRLWHTASNTTSTTPMLDGSMTPTIFEM